MKKTTYLCTRINYNINTMEKIELQKLANQEAELIFGGSKLVWVVVSKKQGYWKILF